MDCIHPRRRIAPTYPLDLNLLRLLPLQLLKAKGRREDKVIREDKEGRGNKI